ncbi:unnamed protein product [Chrysodeixis includens]|uniref:Uncharacterized protein n=1 Tax=Chrysodeixis includens TaxID=689277 RepID=A0A9N8KSD1_CHRIL|nr:unnamed protein product [Chrysodeixis includens]
MVTTRYSHDTGCYKKDFVILKHGMKIAGPERALFICEVFVSFVIPSTLKAAISGFVRNNSKHSSLGQLKGVKEKPIFSVYTFAVLTSPGQRLCMCACARTRPALQACACREQGCHWPTLGAASGKWDVCEDP